jgi:spoIIIJ-associated protein
MSSERSIEAAGESVEEAIAKGLAELGVSSNDVIVEVLEEPSRGMFGLGARPARVRLKLFRSAPPPVAAAPPAAPPPTEAVAAPSRPADESFSADDEDDPATLLDEMHDVEESALGQDARIGKAVLEELLEKMAVNDALVIVRRSANAGEEDNNPWLLDITGPNLNLLIGRRGETLAALQYITRLIASRELEHRANIVVDVSGYKARRSKMLHDLALRMADQAARSKRVVTLEPMPPYERRIIHLALRSRTDVQTKSVGEGSARKVTIVPK